MAEEAWSREWDVGGTGHLSKSKLEGTLVCIFKLKADLEERACLATVGKTGYRHMVQGILLEGTPGSLSGWRTLGHHQAVTPNGN